MPFLLLNLALIFSFFCQGLFANSDLFSLSSGSDETATTSYSLLTPNDQETILNEGPLLNIEDPSANWDLFATNDPDGNLLSDNNLLSACPSDSNNAQPSKMRARDTSCPSNYDLPPKLPKLPDIGEDLKEADGPNRQFVWLINVDGVTIGADEPKYYCLPHTPLYSIPVCGSGILSDRWFGHPPLYPQIDKCSLILPPNALWHCPESEFFCCRDWVPYGVPDSLTGPGLGTGYDCINLMDSGWEGYDSERIQH